MNIKGKIKTSTKMYKLQSGYITEAQLIAVAKDHPVFLCLLMQFKQNMF